MSDRTIYLINQASTEALTTNIFINQIITMISSLYREYFMVLFSNNSYIGNIKLKILFDVKLSRALDGSCFYLLDFYTYRIEHSCQDFRYIMKQHTQCLVFRLFIKISRRWIITMIGRQSWVVNCKNQALVQT